MLDPIKEVLLTALNFFFRATGDYGIAIILLTLAVRVVILPLTIRQIRSMQQMKMMQPKLKQLQAKHKGDKRKLQEEIMKFYSEHKINPLAGCLPLLLQLPVFFALFQVLLQIKGPQPFLFLIPDVTLPPSSPKVLALGQLAAVSYYLLIGLMVLTTYVQQKQISTDPQQDRIMLFMTVFMAFIAWRLPAGVLLYWVTTNVWTVVQQYLAQSRPEPEKGS